MKDNAYFSKLEEIRDFHRRTSIKAVQKEPMDLPIALTQAYFKRYPRFPRIALAAKLKAIQASEMMRRRSERLFDETISITTAEISEILSSLGTNHLELNDKRRYPSAGARYPIEAYLVAWRIEGIAEGVYHYDVRGHALEQILESMAEVEPATIVSPHVTNPAAALILTACLSRTVIKYGLRGYNYALIEAGHVGQEVILAAARSDIGSCCIGGFVESAISQLLDLVKDELPVYVIALGASLRQ